MRSFPLSFEGLICVRQVLCGRLPHRGLRPHEVMCATMRGDRPRKPETMENLGFTDELWTTVERCWRENWNERPEVKEILSSLERATRAWNTRPPLPH